MTSTRRMMARAALVAFSLWMCALPALAQDAPAEGGAVEGAAGGDEAREAAEPEGRTPDPKPSAAEDSVSHDMQVKELEEKVNDFKEKVFRSKSRLVLLKETVLRGRIAGSKVKLVHVNDMGGSVRLERAIYSLDGKQIFNKTDRDGDLADKDEIVLFDGAIVPGKHNVSVLLEFRGNGRGVFQYMEGYKFTVKSSYSFTAEEGKTTQVRVVGFEDGNFTVQVEDKLAVRYELNFLDDTASGGAEGN